MIGSRFIACFFIKFYEKFLVKLDAISKIDNKRPLKHRNKILYSFIKI